MLGGQIHEYIYETSIHASLCNLPNSCATLSPGWGCFLYKNTQISQIYDEERNTNTFIQLFTFDSINLTT